MQINSTPISSYQPTSSNFNTASSNQVQPSPHTDMPITSDNHDIDYRMIEHSAASGCFQVQDDFPIDLNEIVTLGSQSHLTDPCIQRSHFEFTDFDVPNLI